MHLRENEAVTVEPLGVLGVEVHETVEKNVGNGSHAPRKNVSKYYPTLGRSTQLPLELRCQRNLHGGTRVTGVGMRGGIGLIRKAVSMTASCRSEDPLMFPILTSQARSPWLRLEKLVLAMITLGGVNLAAPHDEARGIARLLCWDFWRTPRAQNRVPRVLLTANTRMVLMAS